MKKFTSVSDVENLQEIIKKALQIKENPQNSPQQKKVRLWNSTAHAH